MTRWYYWHDDNGAGDTTLWVLEQESPAAAALADYGAITGAYRVSAPPLSPLAEYVLSQDERLLWWVGDQWHHGRFSPANHAGVSLWLQEMAAEGPAVSLVALVELMEAEQAELAELAELVRDDLACDAWRESHGR